LLESVPSTLSLSAAFVVVVFAGIFINAYLFRIYGAESDREGVKGWRGWARNMEFSPEALGGFSYRRLALVSILGLFLELMMIRWISSEIRVFAYFKNFVLIACFLGFGMGCYLSRRHISLVSTILPLLTLLLLVKLPWQALRDLMTDLPTFVGATSDMHFWELPAAANGWFLLLVLVAAVVIIVPIFCLLTFLFIPVGQLVGWYLNKAANLVFGYTVNIVGSLAGILLYTFLCFFYQPPTAWFLLAGVMMALLLRRVPRLRWAAAGAFLGFAALASLGSVKNSSTYWSPYQKLTVIPRKEAGETVGYVLKTNESWYQQILDLSPEFVAAHPQFFKEEPIQWNPYNVPYHFYPRPPSVLVLGSGMGNDVAAALRNGAGRVAAVEIDPLILKLGSELHPEKPYGSPRVQEVLDDARSYVQNSEDRFDLIVFSLLDSHTTSSYYTNIRIDNYVYTLEALKATRRLLKPDGIFIIKFQVDTPWIAGRLRGLLETVFARRPLQLRTEKSPYGTMGTFFITGSQGRIARAMSESELAAFVANHSDIETQQAPLTTDDWPYFYQREPGLPVPVIVISGVLVLLCWLFMRKAGTGLRSMRWHFFFLGAGFLLLEAQIISKMALLFGTTWVVNSIVIAGLLLLIVAANSLVEFWRDLPVGWAYAGIFLSMLVSYLVPLEKFLFHSMVSKLVLATVVLCLPVFFAGIVFVRSFAREGFPAVALGANLLGGLVGGLLESLSLWTGIRSLVMVAGLFYLASWIALRVEQPLRGAALEALPGSMGT
jgi:SAM-dependent methyltransferase